jgi:RNA polymerase sigma-70 factor (sigma-E family)
MTDAAADATYVDFVGARWPALFRTACLLTGDRDRAEEALQATLVEAYAKWSKVSAADSVEAYVRRMLLNEVLGDRRRLGRRRGRLHLVALDEVEPPTDPHDRLDLWSQLRDLPPRQRAVLVLRYYEDLTEAQAADVLGCAVGTVKSQAHDALRTLRARLADEEVNR